MKKILVIADIDSVHTYNFCRNFLAQTDLEVTLLNLKGERSTVKPDYLHYYESMHYNLAFCKSLRSGHVNYMMSFYKALKELGCFDYVHIHFVSHYVAIPVFLLSRRYEKIILTYWGSDLFRSSATKRLMTLPLLNRSNKISFITSEMFDRFKSLSYPYRKNLKKCQVVDYGNLFFESIKTAQKNGIDNIKAKNILGFPKGKIVISIGYCWRKEMQQLKTLESILGGGFKYKDKIMFVIPAVGIDETNKSHIVDCLERNNADYFIQEEFWDMEQITAFRMATDIFVHAQTTDSLSAAMMEHLYAGGIVVNGEWLKYEVLEKHKVYYLQFERMIQIPELLNKVIDNLDKYRAKCKENQEIINGFASWDYWRPQWRALLFE